MMRCNKSIVLAGILLLIFSGCAPTQVVELPHNVQQPQIETIVSENALTQDVLKTRRRSETQEPVEIAANMNESERGVQKNPTDVKNIAEISGWLASQLDELIQQEAFRDARLIAQQGQELPPVTLDGVSIEAVPGECYARCVAPALYEEYTEQYRSLEASEEISVIPAQFRKEVLEFVLEEESERIEVFPAEYETQTEEIRSRALLKEYAVTPPVFGPGEAVELKLEEEYNTLSVTPAQFEDNTLTVLVKEPGKRLEVVPEEFSMSAVEVLSRGASEEWTVIPAQFGWEEEEVLVHDAYETLTVVSQPVYEPAEETILTKDASTELRAIPATFRTETREILVKAEGEEIELVEQPQYETRSRQLEPNETSLKIKVIAPEYGWVEEEVMISPAYTTYDIMPAQYETITERVEVAPPRLIWVRSKGCDPTNVNDPSCDIVCLEETPSQYTQIRKDVLVRNAQAVPKEIPAQYTTIRKRIMTQPPGVEYVECGDCSNLASRGMATERVMTDDVVTRTIKIPPEYKTVTLQVVDQPARIEKTPISAEYTTITVQKFVKEAVIAKETVPAQYETVRRQVMIESPRVEKRPIPAEYVTVNQRLLAQPASTREIAIEAEYATINQQLLAADATFSQTLAPAKYDSFPTQRMIEAPGITVEETPQPPQIVNKRALLRPESYETVKVPPKYDRVEVTKLVDDAQLQRTNIPERYATIEKLAVKDRGGKLVWRRVLCEVNMTYNTVLQLQETLQAAGFNPGPLDGEYGAKTQAAVKDFQRKNGLPSGPLTLETLEALGLDF